MKLTGIAWWKRNIKYVSKNLGQLSDCSTSYIASVTISASANNFLTWKSYKNVINAVMFDECVLELWPEMATRGRIINQLNKCFFAYFISGTALTWPLDDGHRGNIWFVRITQLSKDFCTILYFGKQPNNHLKLTGRLVPSELLPLRRLQPPPRLPHQQRLPRETLLQEVLQQEVRPANQVICHWKDDNFAFCDQKEMFRKSLWFLSRCLTAAFFIQVVWHRPQDAGLERDQEQRRQEKLPALRRPG